jgi:Zn-dependent peptidase ImmA (M78 family)/DNA-binding XRE family transcriptional regulator
MTITQEELARRLREAREKSGFTQEQVAKALGLVRPVIAQIEAGKRKVSSLELAALARLYGRPLSSFFEEAFEADGISFIWRAIPELHQQPKVQRAISRGLEIINSILELENKLGITRLKSAPAVIYPKKVQTKLEAIQHGKEVAGQERSRLNLGLAPIPDPAAILDSQGILIFGFELPPGISGFTFRSDQAIICAINADEPPVRQRYSIIHEYCHVLCDLNDLPGIVSRSESGKDLREVRADVFAANFLMPEEAVQIFLASRGKSIPSRAKTHLLIKDEIVSYEARRTEQASRINYIDAVQMANHFGVSVESVIWRLNDLKLISEKEKKDLLEKDKSEWGKILKKYLSKQHPLSMGKNKIIYQNAREHLLSLAIEAARKGLISRRKFIELLKLSGLAEKDIFMFPEARRV